MSPSPQALSWYLTPALGFLFASWCLQKRYRRQSLVRGIIITQAYISPLLVQAIALAIMGLMQYQYPTPARPLMLLFMLLAAFCIIYGHVDYIRKLRRELATDDEDYD